jgi:CheY-like chemotaxis protein
MNTTMKRKQLQVLLVDDDQDDYFLTRHFVSQIQEWVIKLDWSSTYDDALTKMIQDKHDVYLLDFHLGQQRTGLELLNKAIAHGCNAPMILLTGLNDRDIDLEAMNSGAMDYLIKGQIDSQLLERSIRYALNQKRVQNALDHAKHEALAASHAKSEFLANMSHEIRTPLNAIIGMTELALETSLSVDQKDYLKIVQSSSEALLSLINDILDFSKIEAGQIDLEKIEFDLQEVVEGVAEILAVRAEAKNLELLCYIDPRLPTHILGDPTRLRQILINLVGNAIKFTEHGEVSVRVELDQGSPEVNPHGNRFNLHFMVIDTGIGIAAENQSKIFEKFSQADRSTIRRFGGTGLGLNISKTLVELMGGEMWLESTAGQGSTFHFRMACVSTVPIQRVDLVQILKKETERLSVLVVDDNRRSRANLEEALSSCGMNVLCAAGVDEALGTLKAHRDEISLAFVDYNMPDKGGAELVKAIADEGGFEDLTVVMLVPLEKHDLRQNENLRIAASLTKPVKQSQLLETLRIIVMSEPQERPRTIQTDKATAEPGVVLVRKILVAEDHDDNRNLLKKILEARGYIIDFAKDGQAAVDAVKSFHYDLILMDVQMPIMDGFDATKRIREVEQHIGEERTPIVALTAHAFADYRQKCLEHDMDDFITKPLKIATLLQTIEKWIDQRPTIQVVDDSGDNRKLIQSFLKKETEYRLIFSQNGHEAVERFKRRPCSVILMDMEMPIMNGYAATTAIRQLKNGQQVPIIALTAHHGREEIQKCLDAGCSSYLSKPIRKNDIFGTLQQYLPTEESKS